MELVFQVAAQPLREGKALEGRDFACILLAASWGSSVRVVSSVSMVAHLYKVFAVQLYVVMPIFIYRLF